MDLGDAAEGVGILDSAAVLVTCCQGVRGGGGGGGGEKISHTFRKWCFLYIYNYVIAGALDLAGIIFPFAKQIAWHA